MTEDRRTGAQRRSDKRQFEGLYTRSYRALEEIGEAVLAMEESGAPSAIAHLEVALEELAPDRRDDVKMDGVLEEWPVAQQALEEAKSRLAAGDIEAAEAALDRANKVLYRLRRELRTRF